MAVSDPEPLFKRPLYGIEQPIHHYLVAFPLRADNYPVYDLPPEILSTLELKLDTDLHPDHAEPQKDLPQPEVPLSASTVPLPDEAPPKATSCAMCGLSFVTVQEQRSHARSDLHAYNLKQKLRGFKSVNEVEFEKLVEGASQSGVQDHIPNADGPRSGREHIWFWVRQ